ncbi:PREDICTED: heat shock 70 kDa protein 12A-like [Cyprinodon variegatus]|uniref:heat shock 70 kDa protein 12A-like n=1 Tax=Cyprinodon variegatus TaxID=28743 RepID=UPI00074280C5|nr:PREDICTED: heat shock 70 kDa protein 12A-like [Cyprinodon variegatus]
MDDLCVIAIDFGTAFSGYAFNISARGEESDPRLKRWGKEYGLETPKTPTCILFNEDKTFLSFGYEAQMKFKDMRGEEAKKHYFFEDFKMTLYKKKLSDLKIKDASGKPLEALKVFSESLRFLKDDALKTISSMTRVMAFNPSFFTWVLTVPAIWDESDKQFMIEAAKQAGIVTEGREENLLIVPEPEAAFIWCMKLQPDEFILKNHIKSLHQSPGTRYIVVDCGGGAIDMTVHEVQHGGALKELHKFSGNNLGGQTVNRKFKQFLREIFPDGVWDEFQQNYPSLAQGIMYEFTHLKQADTGIKFSLPLNLRLLAEKKAGRENIIKSGLGAFCYGYYIHIRRDRLMSFFDESLQGITQILIEIFDSVLHINYMLLVGGFAQSKILQQHIIEWFGRQCEILCPFRAQETTVHGAVELGINLQVMNIHKSSYAYRFPVSQRLDERRRKEENYFTAKGIVKNEDVLRKEGVGVGSEETRGFRRSPATAGQADMQMTFNHSSRKNPDEWGEEKDGPLDRTTSELKLETEFGSTEISALGIQLRSHFCKKSVTVVFQSFCMCSAVNDSST